MAGKTERKRNLTPKQERFALEYFKTGNASEAYRIAYDSENMAPETINRKALEVLENGMIAARVEHLRAKAETKAILSRDRAMEILANIAEGADKESDRVAALKVAGKWSGWEAPVHSVLDVVTPFERYMMRKADGPDQEDELPSDTVSDVD
jgi:hypothetical protein